MDKSSFYDRMRSGLAELGCDDELCSEWVEAAKEYIQTLKIPTEEEIEYMNRVSQKEYRPELLFDDPSVLERIVKHPMALWKCKS